MNVTVSRIGFNNQILLVSNKQKKINNKSLPSFGKVSVKNIKNIGFAFFAASTLSLLACTNKKTNSSEVDVNAVEQTDDNYSSAVNTEKPYTNILTTTNYYYLPKDDNALGADTYDWVEVEHPDGSIEKDSMGYKIDITPDGERTVRRTDRDSVGNNTIITELPDGTKIVRTDYITKNEGEILYTENTFYPSGVIKEGKYYNEHFSDSLKSNVIEQSNDYYNDKGVLLYWVSNVKDPVRDEINNKYDSQGRLIYDDVKNEHYEYKDDSKVPYRSISFYEDCKRITIYNQDESVQKVYFEASDGTITEL